MINSSQRVAISDSSQVGEARRMALSMAAKAKFNETEIARIGIVVTEAANNICKHAERGMLIFRFLTELPGGGLEMLAVDSGPGMDVVTCLRDGYSTAGTPGQGLGSMSRLVPGLDIYSSPGLGSILMARFYPTPNAKKPLLDIGAVCIPIESESVAGDAWKCAIQDQKVAFIVADGLGHGQQAHEASQTALEIFSANPHEPPAELMARLHAALRRTRGAAVALVQLDLEARNIKFTGVGNIAGCVYHAERTSSFVSHNGTVGAEMRKVQEFEYAWPRGSMVVLHSDGIGTRWNFEKLPGILNHSASVISAGLFKEFRRERDDATLVAIREQ